MQITTEFSPFPPMPPSGERRRVADRRQRTLHALVIGTLHPRRRSARRAWDRAVVATDWYRPQWLAAALLIVLFSMADALLTLTLLGRGALEANPIMAAFLAVDPVGFVPAKIALTALGVVLLTVAARVRAFRRVPVSLLLYGVLGGYVALVGYELWLLGTVPRV
ncbi:MAG TPA: DUF5658 family protein [Steroidobacteraceae bacterium]|nr:DUF5658 family protein [Steroidobacteraceae bacterium]